MSERNRVKEAAKRANMRLYTYEVRFAGPWSRQPPVVCEAHTIDAARNIAEVEHPGQWLGQCVKIG